MYKNTKYFSVSVKLQLAFTLYRLIVLKFASDIDPNAFLSVLKVYYSDHCKKHTHVVLRLFRVTQATRTAMYLFGFLP